MTTNIIKPNWDIFRAKFSENPQYNFEWFCYLLFCKEYKRPLGIFRYFNQSAIETEPITIGNKNIGWQAKFYDTSLSSNKTKIIKTLKNAKRDYPDINKLLFYTNKEWGQYRGKVPKGKIEAEKEAINLGIELEWRTASFFESPFVAIKNILIAQHFFNLEQNITSYIKRQVYHTAELLKDIRTSILFNNQEIEINRDNIINELNNSKLKSFILSGHGGVGKTAVIKKLHEKLKDIIPFYTFKATEFKLRNIDDLFKHANLLEFIEFHKDEERKIIIIDSAEKLLDIRDFAPLKEFLSALIKNNWQIIFTSRNSYVENLNYQFFEIYNVAPQNINIKNLEKKELQELADKFQFDIPRDTKLASFIQNPFYLSEYLKHSAFDQINYADFKEKMWKINIRKNKNAREECFLKIAFQRANEGKFYIVFEGESRIIDDELCQDGILGHDSLGYFITHDIYEEWALERIIDREFNNKLNYEQFFEKIKESLPIRRSFRNWVSEKLLLSVDEIKSFIDEVISNQKIKSFWKDEILISVLRSEYSSIFFDTHKKRLLDNSNELLKRMTFLLRLTCKELDYSLFKRLGINNVDLSSLTICLTKPKGQGWKEIIRFISNNLSIVSQENIDFILPVLQEWNNTFKKGDTTRLASKIVLKYYQDSIGKDIFYHRDNTEENFIKTILNGCSEIKDEFEKILNNILVNKWTRNADPYYKLSWIILTKFDGLQASSYYPEYVMKLADLFWTYKQKNDKYFIDYSSRQEVEVAFGITDKYEIKYFPASALQTPIYALLSNSLKETIDFILDFTNRAVEKYVKSGYENGIASISINIDDKKTVTQHISNSLWGMYRGTSSPVSPYLLQSIHMGLEKFFLEHGENTKSEVLENWLLYLLRNSKSASITAVVSSVVLKFPEKTFNIAKILFKTKELFFYDTRRLLSDQSQKSSLEALANFGYNNDNKFYENERINACDDKHRQHSLEHQCLFYQLFKSENISEKTITLQQKEIWKILDKYYADLPEKATETDGDKTWKLYLGRMDRRKMEIKSQKNKDGKVFLQFHPELEPDVKEYSEKSIQESNKNYEFMSLRLWADFKLTNDVKYKEYTKYENTPKLALEEIRQLVEKLNSNEKLDEGFFLFNDSIPAKVCSVLAKFHIDILTQDDIEFCKRVILDTAKMSLDENYNYQISDGCQEAISVLPILFTKCPNDKEIIKLTLLFNLFFEYHVGGLMSNASFSVFSVLAIKTMWEDRFDDAQSLLLGYLLLKPEYNKLREKIRRENIKKNIYTNNTVTIQGFIKENEDTLVKVVENTIELSDIKDIENLDLSTYKTAFQLIPRDSSNCLHKNIALIITSKFAEKILADTRDDRIRYELKYDFFESYTAYVLCRKKEEIKDFLKPFFDSFKATEAFADLLKEFVSVEDILNCYDNFWFIWEHLKDKIIALANSSEAFRITEKIIKSYLFAQIPWKESAKKWHTFKEKDKGFFKEISLKIGYCPAVLYSISKLLNDIGTPYLNDGITWLYIMLNHKKLVSIKFESNTIYYIEQIARKYIYEKSDKIRRTPQVKQEVLFILDCLIENGSVTGYMLRENIL